VTFPGHCAIVDDLTAKPLVLLHEARGVNSFPTTGLGIGLVRVRVRVRIFTV
jgi:hypothetical protein